MEENIIEEKPEKSQFLERLSICLRIIALISFIIGVYLLLTNPSTSSNATSISPKMQALINNMPYIGFGMSVIISLTMFIIAFIDRKESPKLSLILLAIGIVVPLLTWLLASSISQTELAVVPQ